MINQNIRIAYILKMYPRFSETFIVNEILSHEAAGLDIEIFSLRAPADGRFHEDHARVRAPVTYVPSASPKVAQLWTQIHLAGARYPALWSVLAEHPDLDVDDVYQALLMADMIHEGKFTLMHAHFGSIATTVARLVSKLTGVPYLFTAHAKDIFHESVVPMDLCHKLADAASVITVSDYNMEYLRNRYDDAADAVIRVYNGLDLSKFRYESPLDRPRCIVGVGRLVEKKGWNILIDACAILAQRGCDFECELIGTGQLEEELHGQVAQHRLDDRVQMLGPRSQGDAMRHVQNSGVFVTPCVIGSDGNRDGLPTALLEAMALGTPCISTDVTGIPEAVRNGETGLVVPQHDAQSVIGRCAGVTAQRCWFESTTGASRTPPH